MTQITHDRNNYIKTSSKQTHSTLPHLTDEIMMTQNLLAIICSD